MVHQPLADARYMRDDFDPEIAEVTGRPDTGPQQVRWRVDRTRRNDDLAAPELPRYDHDNLGGCFYEVKRIIDDLLGRGTFELGYEEVGGCQPHAPEPLPERLGARAVLRQDRRGLALGLVRQADVKEGFDGTPVVDIKSASTRADGR